VTYEIEAKVGSTDFKANNNSPDMPSGTTDLINSSFTTPSSTSLLSK